MDCWGSLHSQPRLLGKFPAGQSVSTNKMDCPLGQPCDRYKQHTHTYHMLEASRPHSISAGYRKG